MQAAVLRNKTIVLDEIARPEPGPGEVLIRIESCGICGSDLHFAAHGEEMLQANRDMGLPVMTDMARDIVMGHEFAGVLEAHGEGCKGTVAVGCRVAAFPISARESMPVLVGFSNEVPGAYSEYVVVAEPAAIPVPDGLDADVAAMTEPMAVAKHAVAKGRLDELGSPAEIGALVVGCGPIGLAVIAVLRAAGVETIVASDLSAKRRELATAMGATATFDPREDPPHATFLGQVVDMSRSADTPYGLFQMPAMRPSLIFECVGVPGVLHQLSMIAPPRARIVVVGVCMEPDQIQPSIAINKELDFQFVLGYTTDEFAETLSELADGTLDPRPMITGSTGLAGVADAFRTLASPDEHAKIVVRPGDGAQIVLTP